MQGKILWIGVRPERKAPLNILDEVWADAESGLQGDRASNEKRQVTVIFRDALDRAATMLGRPVEPESTRRNILVDGISSDLMAGTRLRVGEALLEVTGPCLPCSRMDETLGEGGRSALANAVAGGLTTKVIESGRIAVGDVVAPEHVNHRLPQEKA